MITQNIYSYFYFFIILNEEGNGDKFVTFYEHFEC